jgi:mono/diheme cytochrome c family protein
MKPSVSAFAVCAGLLIAGTGAIAATEKIDPGKREYDANCASCHGVTGRGDGPYAPALTKAPADLTVLQIKNGGTFPFGRVYEVIDGRAAFATHSTREMPVWGTRYQLAAAEYYRDVLYDPEAYIHGRIVSVTEYVYRLQTK